MGAWTAFEEFKKVKEATARPVQVRKELGANVCRLKGNLQVKAGETLKAGEIFAVLPEGLRPLITVLVTCVAGTGTTPVSLSINNLGELTLPSAAELKAPELISLDGVTFNLT